MAGGSPADRPISRWAIATRVRLSIISTTSRAGVAEPLGDPGGDEGGAQPLDRRGVGGGDDDDRAGQPLGAEVVLEELADLAAALADQGDHRDLGVGAAGDHREQAWTCRRRSRRRCRCAGRGRRARGRRAPGRRARPAGLGVRALDALVPAGRGQRVGIFAGSGVGKSTLLSMIARGAERGGAQFLENDLGPEGLARSVVVVSTSDAPPVERLRAALRGRRIAEWFATPAATVDSLTRVVAQREIGLSAGEPPDPWLPPPSVFGILRGCWRRPGATGPTGLYTVLVEGDNGDTAG